MRNSPPYKFSIRPLRRGPARFNNTGIEKVIDFDFGAASLRENTNFRPCEIDKRNVCYPKAGVLP